MESLVIGGGTLVDVDNHGRSSFAEENGLKEFGEFALAEGDVGVLHPYRHHRRRKKGAVQKTPGAESKCIGIKIQLVHLSVWLLRSAVMHLPRMSRELLMFPASFSRSPNVLVLLHLSEPARSHRENLTQKYLEQGINNRKTLFEHSQGLDDTDSEILFTVPPSIMSSFIVNMLWL